MKIPSAFAHDLNHVDKGAAHMLELSELAEKDPEFYLHYACQHTIQFTCRVS